MRAAGLRGSPASLLALSPVLLGLWLSSCHHARHHEMPLASTRYGSVALGENPLRGDIVPVHDPGLAHQGSTYYAFTTDLPFTHATTYLAIRCSPDARTWHACGHVFDTLPAWIRREVPGAVGLWAPEVAFFHGLYHLYYSASTLGSQRSAIGLATNLTLDPSSANYRWVDQGEVLGSQAGDDFNAIDPGVLVRNADLGPASENAPPDVGSGGQEGAPPARGRERKEGEVWLTYGSYWSGIKQRRLDPSTGLLSSTDPRVYALASRPLETSHAIEGASMTEHGGYYYLFVSIDRCCEMPIERDNYRQVVGRSRSLHGPFVGEDGSQLLEGGGTVLLATDAAWLAPGGGSVCRDEATGETMLAFHALRQDENGALYLWIKRVTWRDGWPVLEDR